MSLPETMTAWAVAEHEEPLKKITLPIPAPTGTEVLVKVTHCGVCHSDLHFWEGFYSLGGGKKMLLSERGVKLPRAIGHEIFGTVAKLGSDASGVSVGDPRIVYPWLGCGLDSCRRCAQGEDNLCSAQRSLGVLQHGGMAEYVLVPDAKYLVDAGGVDPSLACTFGCSGITVLSAIRKVFPLDPDDAVVLIGAGGLGLSAIAMLRALGHRKIVSLDIGADKLESARQAGATATVDSAGKNAVQDVLSAAGGPVLAVIDFVNGSATAALAFGVLAKGGKMVQVGVMGGQLELPLIALIFKAVTLMGNNTGNVSHLKEVSQLAQEGKLAPIPITVVPIDEAHDALMRLRDGKVTGRIVLKYQ